MRVCYLDLETFWSAHHSLSKMNPVAYCMHRETELQSLSYAFDNEEPQVLWGEAAMREFIASEDWSDTMVVGHNMAGFDSMLLSWRLGLRRPRVWGCTLAMARALYRAEVGGSLKMLCDHLGIGVKGDLEAIGTKGRKLETFTAAEKRALAEYNEQDVRLCRKLFQHMVRHTVKRELAVIDMTIRMLVNPRLRVDTSLLDATLAQERVRKEQALLALEQQLGVNSPEDLRRALISNPQFAELLRALGVEPPTKTSPRTGNETFAFAKTDDGMKALLEHEDSLVADAAATRLGIKSSLLETRIESFLIMAKATGGRMPIALNYAGAHTLRWSGAFKVNQQNLPRVNPKDPKLTDALRRCLIAPPGHKIVAVDLSGIELRVNHFLWKVPSSMLLYQQDAEADLYRAFAARFYSCRPEDVTKEQRQFAKMVQLGLGFGMGWKKFREGAKLQGYDLSANQAQKVVYAWRDMYASIVEGWELCARALPLIAAGESHPIDTWGHCVTVKDGIRTPYGMLRYPQLRTEYDANLDVQWVYGLGRHKTKAYGGIICENLVQHLARQILVGHMLEIQKRYPIAHTVHDEVILVVPEDEAPAALDFALGVMKTSPQWWPEIVLSAEGSFGDNYGETK